MFEKVTVLLFDDSGSFVKEGGNDSENPENLENLENLERRTQPVRVKTRIMDRRIQQVEMIRRTRRRSLKQKKNYFYRVISQRMRL